MDGVAPAPGVYENVPAFFAVSQESTNFSASLNVAGFTVRPACLAVTRAVIIQPVTDRSPGCFGA
jgi:hypothetical protein